MRRIFRYAVLGFLSLAVVASAGCGKKKPTEEALLKRVQEYNQAWVKKDFGAVWDFVTPAGRELLKLGTDRNKFIEMAKVGSQRMTFSSFTVVASELVGDAAVVFVQKANLGEGRETKECLVISWVWAKSNWYIEYEGDTRCSFNPPF